MRFIGNDPNILDAFYTATADGSIAAGKPVIVTAGGITLGTQSSEFDAQAHYLSTVYDTSNDKVVIAYGDPGNSNYGTAVVGTVSGSDVTFGTPVVFESDTVSGNFSITSAFDSANNKVVIAYRDGGNSNEGTAIVGTVSGTSISFGSAVVFETGETYDLTATFDDVAEKVVIAYRDVSNSQYGTAIVGTVSGTSISFGTATVFESAATEYIFALAMPNWSNTSERRILIAYSDGGNGGALTLITGTVSGTGISFGSARVADASLSYDPVMALMTNGDGINRAVCAYRDDGSSGNGKAFTVRAIDTTNNNESASTFDSGNDAFKFPAAAYDASQQKVLLAYRDATNSNQGEYVYATPSANGESLTYTTPAVFYEDAASGVGQSITAVYDPDGEKVVLAYRKPNLAGAAKTIFNDPGGKVKEIAETSGIGSASTFNSNGSYHQACAYDTTNDKLVIAYRDDGNSSYGTAVVATFDGSSFSFGTPVVFESAQIAYTDITFNSNAGKVVIAYEDKGNSSYGTAVVGTVSGTSISFGTPAVFESATTRFISVEQATGSSKVFLSYRDVSNSSYGTGCIGEISGTSISYGTASVFKSAFSSNMGSAYDDNAGKCAFFYSSGTNGYARVASLSGTSISYGTENEFYTSSGGTAGYDKSVVYHASGNKIVAGFRDLGDGNSAYAVVGTISGTSISFGTAVQFYSAYSVPIRAVYNSDDVNVVFFFELGADASKNAVIIGTVSGTSISFGTHEVWQTEDADMGDAAYDPDQSKTLFVYRDVNDSNYGKARSFTPSTTNLTSENYIGITDQAYTDGQDATVAVVGCIDRNQTSLTAGQQYFVQNDGTLSTTAGSPSVLAGTAISATELAVKE